MEENIFSEFESRNYLDPTISRDEQISFIDNLRETQAKNTAQINADTYALGSQLPSNLGGLSGAEDTFVARYQTPQTNQTVANLRLAAQQSALNTALSNLQNAYKQRYNQAMLNYQKRAAASSATTPSTTTPTQELPISTNTGTSENLGVRENEEARKEFDNTNQAGYNDVMNRVTQLQNSGNYNTANSVPFMYYIDGKPFYGIIHRDKFNKMTGVSSATMDYNLSTGQKFLNDLANSGNFYNANGQKLNSINALFGI